MSDSYLLADFVVRLVDTIPCLWPREYSFAVLLYSLTRQGGGDSLIWPKGVWAAEQGTSFIVLGAKQGIQIIFT